MMKNTHLWAIVIVSTLFFAACGKDPVVSTPYESGVFVIHEGAFLGGTGTVSFYNRSIGGSKNDIFALENSGAAVGNVLQSMTIVNGKGYLMVNNANRIIVVDAKTFKFQDSIVSTTLPRYLLNINDTKAYVSEWGQGGITGAIKVLDLTTKKFTKTIATGKGADKMLRVGNSVWTVNDGGFDIDSTVAIVDIATESVSSKINVGIAPNSLVQDTNGDVWVLCGGEYSTPNGRLVRIKNNVIAASFNVPQGAAALSINNAKNTLYFVAGNSVYQKDLTATAPIVWASKPNSTSVFGSLYGMAIDPKTDNVFIADAKNYASAGTVYIFNSAKTLQDSLKTGIIPSNFCFQ
jgi:hypothetical protein